MEGKSSFWTFFLAHNRLAIKGWARSKPQSICALSSAGIWGELSSPTCAFVPGPKQSEEALPTLGTFRRLGERLKNSLGCQLARASSAGRGAWALSRQDRGTSGTTRGSYSLIWTPETALP